MNPLNMAQMMLRSNSQVMNDPKAAAGDFSNVSAECVVRMNCCRIGSGGNTVSVVNTGDAACVLAANPVLIIEGE